jgi:flagellar basal-body rod protein FlgB
MVGKLDEYLRFNETALNLRAQRQQLIASNIANADTPNYKARDFDFTSALQGALSRSVNASSPTELVKTTQAHLNGAAKESVGGVPLQYRTIQQGNVDGNTVEMDVERNQFTDNAIRYEAGLTLINAQIKSMLAAIQG